MPNQKREMVSAFLLLILLTPFFTNCADQGENSVSSENVQVGEQSVSIENLSRSPEFLKLQLLFESSSSTPEQLKAAYESTAPLYTLPQIEGFVVEASSPLFIEGEPLGDDEKATCESLSYADSIVSISQIVSQIQSKGQCGDVEFNFCLKVSKESSESTFQEAEDISSTSYEPGYFLSEVASIPLPCESAIFTTPQIVVNNRNFPGTNVENPVLGYDASRFISRYYLTVDPECRTGGEWLASSSHSQWPFNLISNPTTTVYAKFEDIFSSVSDCYQYEIKYDTQSPENLTLSIGTLDFSPSVNVKLNLTSTSQDIVKLHVISGTCSEDKTPDENSVAFLYDGQAIDWQLKDSEGIVQSVAIYAEDIAGNIECVESSVTLDSTPPSIDMASFSEGTHTNTRDVNLVINNTGATQYYLSQKSCDDDQSIWQEVTSSTMTIPVALSEGEGAKSVFFKVRDRAENEAECKAVSIVVDTTSPALSLISLDSDSLTTDFDYRVEVSWNSAQDNSPIESYQLSLGTKDSEGSFIIASQQQVSNLNSLSFQFPHVRLSPWDTYYVLLEATDIAGNTSEQLECETPINYHQKVLDFGVGGSRSCIIVEDDEDGTLDHPIRKLKCWGGGTGLGFDNVNLDGSTYVPGTTHSYGKNVPFVRLPYENTGGGIKSFDMKTFHTCAIAMDSTVRCWGNNSHSRLGLGVPDSQLKSLGASVDGAANQSIIPTDDNPDPALVRLGDLVPEKICLIETNTCILAKRNGTYTRDDGLEIERREVACWGLARRAGIGSVSEAIGSAPGDMVTIVNGDEISNLESVKLVDQGVDATVLDIACGRHHACALIEFSDSTTKVKCWGDNYSGSSKTGVMGHAEFPIDGSWSSSNPSSVIGDSMDEVGSYDPESGHGMKPVGLPPGRIKSIGTSNFTNCALMDDSRTLYCWGSNHNSELGLDDHEITNVGFYEGSMDSMIPISLPLENNQPPIITKLAFGDISICALTESKNLYCWGSNRFGKFGIGSDNLSKIGDGQDADGNALLEMGPNLMPTFFRGEYHVGKVDMIDRHLCGISDENSKPKGLLACYGQNHNYGGIDPNLENSYGGNQPPMLPRP